MTAWADSMRHAPGVPTQASAFEIEAMKVPVVHEDFSEGMEVRLTCLQQQIHLNGRLGTLVKFDTERGRWQVKLTDTGICEDV